ncbi:MAG: NUDIX domain-containing protein [Caldilineaceae bacterium]|nr:NUDIX domain-containing protein [Caldilineaceae bacterium]
MIIFPAIDLHQGRCVRLRQGNPTTETVLAEDPVTVAQQWVQAGAEWLHVVNLDGALGASQEHLDILQRSSKIWIQHPGRKEAESPETDLMRRLPINLQKLREICRTVNVPVQFGGGLRTLKDIRLALELGAERVVLGTIAVEQPELLTAALDQWGAERIVVSIDVNNGKVATHGWQTNTDVDAIDLGHRVYAMGVRRVIYTDIRRSGTLGGVNVSATTQLGDLTSLRVIASGGVADIHDIERLKAHEQFNIDGVIVGQSIYTNTLDLAAAVELGHRPLRRQSAGIIPYRYQDEHPEFLLLFNLFFEQWQFPRGGVDGGDCNQDCAIQEFEEETGLSVIELHPDCKSVLEYTTTIRDYEIERKVVYYLAEVSSNEIALGHENLCEARWLPADEAWELLTDTAPEQLPALDAAVAYLHEMA